MADVKAIAEALVNISSEEVAELAEKLKKNSEPETEEKAALVRMDFRKRISKHKRQKK